ncbi:unnamed protein product [Oreochromis niloticus]|nr:unnamed protein product [Mustela putorius furo]
MRVQFACLLLLLLSAAVLSQTYNDFVKMHVLPETAVLTCDEMMKQVNNNKQCKAINVFINEKLPQIKALCENKKNESVTHLFDVVDCRKKNEGACTYTEKQFKANTTIKCENSQPVYLENVNNGGYPSCCFCKHLSFFFFISLVIQHFII